MIVKEIEFNREKLLSGINKIASAVGSTMGPMGRTVLIESENHVGGVTVTKDGVTVAKSIVLEDPIENLAVTLVKQAADRTAVNAGDGTTTSVVLTQAIIEDFLLAEHENHGYNIREMKKEAEMIIEELKKMAVPVTDDMLYNVATISANGDDEIGSIVHEAYTKVGRDGVVTVENSATNKTYSQVVNGMRVNRGWSSKYMLTDQKKQEIVLEKPYVFISDSAVPSVQSIEHILSPIIAQNRPILFISEIEDNAMNALNLNKMKGVIKVGAVVPPQFGFKRKDLMADIAAATGGRYITDEMGDDLGLMTIDDLGQVDKAIIGKDSTVLILSDDAMAKGRIADIREIEATTPEEIAFKNERIAILSGGIGVIYVGANSDIEQKEKRDRVDDAVCATAAAIEEGILPGGGHALLRVGSNLNLKYLGSAITAPAWQILHNAGYEVERKDEILSSGVGYNPVSGVEGDMIGMGIIDPLKVTRNAVENAVSVASTILTTTCTIYNIRANEGGR
jgi:chaperonin GroEL